MHISIWVQKIKFTYFYFFKYASTYKKKDSAMIGQLSILLYNIILMVTTAWLRGRVTGIWCLPSHLVSVIIHFSRCKICTEIVLNRTSEVSDSWVYNRKVIILWGLTDGGKSSMDVKIVCINFDGSMESIGDFSNNACGFYFI